MNKCFYYLQLHSSINGAKYGRCLRHNRLVDKVNCKKKEKSKGCNDYFD